LLSVKPVRRNKIAQARARPPCGLLPHAPSRRPVILNFGCGHRHGLITNGQVLGEARMKALLAVSGVVDRINTFVGKKVAWLILAAVLISATNAVIRKAFDISSNAWLEAQWYLFGAVFMLTAAYTLLKNEHVRIDVLASNFSNRTREWIDLICHLTFLLPFCIIMTYLAWPFFFRSFSSGEMSTNAGGLIVWPAKAFVLVGFVLLTAQALSEIIKKIAILRGLIEDDTPPSSHGLTHEIEAELKSVGDRT
jgi:TRAP-type mannitol/chloroaromatic compound transport system permease small subunit